MDKFNTVYEERGKWLVAYVEELPGANTQGKTLEEAKENLKEAVQLILEANRKIAERTGAGRKIIREELIIT